MKAKISILLFTLGLSLGCKKPDKVNVVNDGDYTGLLVVTNSAKSVPNTYPVVASLKNGRFNITYKNISKPAAGSGTYTFNKGLAVFANEGAYTADFDWNMILNGEYEIKSNATDLKLIKKFKSVLPENSPATSYAYLEYKYILKKAN